MSFPKDDIATKLLVSWVRKSRFEVLIENVLLGLIDLVRTPLFACISKPQSFFFATGS